MQVHRVRKESDLRKAFRHRTIVERRFNVGDIPCEIDLAIDSQNVHHAVHVAVHCDVENFDEESLGVGFDAEHRVEKGEAADGIGCSIDVRR